MTTMGARVAGAASAGLALTAWLLAGALPAPVAGAATAGQPGASWTSAQAPVPADHATVPSSVVTSTSCPTPGWCVAVGTTRTWTSTTPRTEPTTLGPAAEVYSDGTWAETAVPLPPVHLAVTRSSASLPSVSCAGPGDCVAVGDYVDQTGNTASLLEQLSGTTWSALPAPAPPNAATGTWSYSRLTSVSCPLAGSCVAVGTYETATKGSAPVADVLSGGTWSATGLAVPSNGAAGKGSSAGLTSVSCASAQSCTAVGYYDTAAVRSFGLIETWAGSSWTPAEAPLGIDPGQGPKQEASLDSVSCGGPGSCAAVGTYRAATGTDDSYGLIDTLAGGTWTGVAAPEPANAGTLAYNEQTATVLSVSCPTPGYCVAAGDYVGTAGTPARGLYYPLADVLSGGSWSDSVLPLPPNVDAKTVSSFIRSVSCSAPGSCAAVGEYERATLLDEVPLLETLSGGTWQPTEGTAPGDGVIEDGELLAVSCVAGGCAAGGEYYLNETIAQNGLLETADLAPPGYFEAASDGGIFAFTAPFHGSMGGKPLNAPIVTAAADPLTGGYYEEASDGGIFAFTAPFHGSMGGKPLNAPIVGMAVDTRTGGYWLVASDGGIFAFTAPFLGSMGGKPLNEPIVGMAFDPMTGGYWEVASDGGLFSFGAPFLGSMGGKPLVKPIVGMTFDSLTDGYYEVASDGGLFAFTAPFHGSMGGKPLNEPIVGMAFDYATGGYWEVASDGGLFAFTAPFDGSMGGKPLNEPIVTMALG
jgi:hypothetical protein